MSQTTSKNERPSKKIFRPPRPFPVSILFWIVLLWVLLGWLRFGRVIIDRNLILDLLPSGLYWYLLLAGISWGILGLPLLWGILRRASWTVNLLWGLAIFYPAVYWVERWLLWADPNAQKNWPFMLGLTALWFGLVVWVSISKKARNYFKKANDKG